MWGAFGALVVALLLVDFVAFGRRVREPSLRNAVGWSIGWTLLGVAFAGVLWAWVGRTTAEEYLAGFLIEKSLSIDNLFVFALIFAYFAVPKQHQRRVLFWGIVGAIVLRGIFIATGAALLDAFHLTIYVFGAFLVLTGIRMARHSNVEIHPERNPALRLLNRVMPLTMRYHGNRLTAREAGRRVATPMLAALVLVAAFDVVFAVDSIPAIFAITTNTFIVYTSNVFAILGLRSMYFLLAGVVEKFRFLRIGLAIVLTFIGIKMLIVAIGYHIPIWFSLIFVAVVLLGSVGASLLIPPKDGEMPKIELPPDFIAPD
jgi:tellurite resistance protein TerC